MAVSQHCALCGHAVTDQRFHGEEGRVPLAYRVREEKIVTYAFTKPVITKGSRDDDDE